MLNLQTLGFGLALSIVDIIMMPLVKEIAGGWPFYWMILPMLVYSLDPIIFYFALKSESMAIMNLVWNLTSNVVVTLIGILLLKEVVSPTKALGIALSFLALFFMTYEGLEKKIV
jgi:drug/metabolite transporter (DMT)-like permease